MRKAEPTRYKAPPALRIIPWLFPKLERVFPWLANRVFVYIFFKPLKYKTPDTEKDALRTAERTHVTVRRKRIAVFSWGTGPAILMVHGWAGRGTQFRKFIAPLNAAGYKVVAFDGPAHGLSDGHSTEIMEFREAIEAVVHKAGGVMGIVSHSFGGSASLYAISKGLPVKTLVAISSPAIGDEVINAYRRVLNASPRVGEYFKRYVIKRSGKTFDEWTSLEFIKHVPDDLNLLLVHDKNDQEVSIEHPLRLHESFPAAELFITEGLGHHRILKSDEVIKGVVKFLQTHTVR